MLVYIVTVAVSAFFVPHYLSIFWEPLNTTRGTSRRCNRHRHPRHAERRRCRRRREAVHLLAVVDFATQVLLVIVGFALVLSPQILVDNVHGAWRRPARTSRRDPRGDARVHGCRDGLEAVRGGCATLSGPAELYKLVAGASSRSLHAPTRSPCSTLPVERIDGQLTTLLALPPEDGGIRERPDPRRRGEHRARRPTPRRGGDLRGILAATILFLATHAGSSAPRGSPTRWRPTAAAGGLSQAAPAVQDAVAVPRALRGDRADPR